MIKKMPDFVNQNVLQSKLKIGNTIRKQRTEGSCSGEGRSEWQLVPDETKVKAVVSHLPDASSSDGEAAAGGSSGSEGVRSVFTPKHANEISISYCKRNNVAEICSYEAPQFTRSITLEEKREEKKNTLQK